MKRKITIVMLILTAILNFCSKEKSGPDTIIQGIIKPDENKRSSVTFTLEDKIHVPKLLYPMLAISAAQDRIYIYGWYMDEPEKFIIKVYNRKLEYILQRTFFVGQGPGDVAATNIITPIDDKIYISGNSNSRVGIFNSNLDYIDCIKYSWERVGGPFPLMDNGNYFIGMETNLIGKNNIVKFKLVSFPDMREKVILEKSIIHPSFNNGIYLIDDRPNFSSFCKDKNIYFSYMNDYHLLKYNLKGDKLKDVIVKVKKIKISETEKKLYLKDHFQLKNYRFKATFSDYVMPASRMVPLNKGFIMIRRENYSTDCNGMAEGDYFNYGIEFVGKVKIPCFYQVYLLRTTFWGSYQYDDGFLFLVNEVDEQLWLEKWQVEE